MTDPLTLNADPKNSYSPYERLITPFKKKPEEEPATCDSREHRLGVTLSLFDLGVIPAVIAGEGQTYARWLEQLLSDATLSPPVAKAKTMLYIDAYRKAGAVALAQIADGNISRDPDAELAAAALGQMGMQCYSRVLTGYAVVADQLSPTERLCYARFVDELDADKLKVIHCGQRLRGMTTVNPQQAEQWRLAAVGCFGTVKSMPEFCRTGSAARKPETTAPAPQS